jgi:hypothetical protein
MSSDGADRYRQQAEACRQQAQKAVSPLDKEAWLRVAQEWLMLRSQPRKAAGSARATAKFLGRDVIKQRWRVMHTLHNAEGHTSGARLAGAALRRGGP